MNTQPSTEFSLGPVKKRKPSTAMNLSLFLPGLGQIYCGSLRRGLLHLSLLAAILALAVVLFAMETTPPMTSLLIIVVLSIIPTIYSAWDARRLALECREDYRLKDCNRLSVYVALSFLVMSLAVGLAFSIRENFLHLFVMVGNSMNPTLSEGTRILVRKDSYRDSEPTRNELVAFFNPANRRQTWVKRVIGLPGDTLEIKDGIVHINGDPLQEVPDITLDQTNMEPLLIPDYHCYVLGDNRLNSKDSRHIGPVPMIALVGKVVFTR